MYSANPPDVFIPRPYPVAITLVLSLKSERFELSMIPTASIPGVCGNFLVNATISFSGQRIFVI
jgi:hypothetical protein